MGNRFLNMSLTENSGVRKQDGSSVIGGVARNTGGRYLAFDFIQDKWPKVKSYYPSAFSLSGIMKNTMGNRNTAHEVGELKSFEEKYRADLGSAQRAVSQFNIFKPTSTPPPVHHQTPCSHQAVEKGEANVAWMDANYESIWSWLKQQNKISTRG